MSAVAAAAAAAVSWVTTTAAAVGTAASMALTAAGWSAGQIAFAATVGSTALKVAAMASVSALMVPQVEAGGSPVAFKADPLAPIAGVMGRFGVAGRQMHANVWGKDNLYMSFAVALSLGPIQSYEAFTANRLDVTFPGAQGLAASVEPYKDKMWQTRRLGLPTDAYLSPPTGVSDGSPSMTEWTSSHTLPGFAHVFWTMRNNSKRASYESGVPAPLWTLHGMKVWDPRLDSTYPGGSGTSRRDDWSTWTYSEDPYLHALAFVRGHHKLNTDGTVDRTKRIAGVGAPDAAIDIAAFVEGANVCDANDWTISGEWTTADDKWQVLAAMLQAGGGVPLNRGAQISCMVEAPRTSILTLTGADIVGSVSLNVMASRRDRPNTIIPRARLEAQFFEEVALGAVSSSTYVTEDGGEVRSREVPYRYVGQAKQAAELAAYGLANARETLKAALPCKPHLLGLRAGDAFTVTEPELGLNGQKFVVLKRSFDPASAMVTLDVRSETDAKHAWALGQVADPPATPSLTALDPIPTAPDTADWTITVRPADTDGAQQPGLIVTGSAVGDNVGAVQIEVGPTGSGPWEQVYQGPPTTEAVAINALDGGQDRHVAITYWSLKGVPSDPLIKGPYTPAGLVSESFVGAGPLATSSLTEADIQGVFRGAFAGDAAAITGGLQDGDSYIDTSVSPHAFKTVQSATITEVDMSGIRTQFETQSGVPSSTYAVMATITVPDIPAGSLVKSWWTAAIETTPNPTTVGSGTLACTGDYKITETGGSIGRTLITGAWSALAPGGTDVTAIIIDSVSDAPLSASLVSQDAVIASGGARTYDLQMRLDAGDVKPLVDAGLRLFVQIQRYPT